MSPVPNEMRYTSTKVIGTYPTADYDMKGILRVLDIAETVLYKEGSNKNLQIC